MAVGLLWRLEIMSVFSNSKQPFLLPKPSSKTGQTSQCASAWTTFSCCSRKQQKGNLFPSASQPYSRTMEVVSPKINSDHCSAPTRQTQQRGRQRVKRVLRLQRMGNKPTSDSALPKKVQCRSLRHA